MKKVKQDSFKAVKYYQKSCGLNEDGGCVILGLCIKKVWGLGKAIAKP